MVKNHSQNKRYSQQNKNGLKHLQRINCDGLKKMGLFNVVGNNV